MGSKLYFAAVAVFFISMNALLLRSVIGDKDLGVAVPVESVHRRLLESADDSNLQIRHHGEKIGFCRWSASLLTRAPLPSANTASLPEGMVASIGGYHLDFDGNLSGEDFNKVRFNFSLDLDPVYAWTRIHLRLKSPASEWELSSTAIERSLRITVTEGDHRREHSLAFTDLGNPAAVLAALGGHAWSSSLSGLSLPWSRLGTGPATFGLKWHARTARRKIGNSHIPVYRLEAPLFDEYKIVVTLLESGEILRVDLPDEWALVNDDLLNM